MGKIAAVVGCIFVSALFLVMSQLLSHPKKERVTQVYSIWCLLVAILVCLYEIAWGA